MYAALLTVGWQLKRQSGSHRTLSRAGYPDYVFAFHDSDEVGPKMLANREAHRAHPGQTVMGETANYTQERSVDHRGAQLLRTSIVAGRSGKR